MPKRRTLVFPVPVLALALGCGGGSSPSSPSSPSSGPAPPLAQFEVILWVGDPSCTSGCVGKAERLSPNPDGSYTLRCVQSEPRNYNWELWLVSNPAIPGRRISGEMTATANILGGRGQITFPAFDQSKYRPGERVGVGSVGMYFTEPGDYRVVISLREEGGDLQSRNEDRRDTPIKVLP